MENINLTPKQYEILINIIVGIQKGRIKIPTFTREFAEEIAHLGRNDKNFKIILTFMEENEIIKREEADFNRKKIVYIDKEKIILIIRSSDHFQITKEFIENTVFGHRC